MNHTCSIPIWEYAQRLTRAQALLRETDLDALLVTSKEADFANVRYFSDYWPIFETAGVLVPREGDATLLIGPESETYARDRSRIARIRKMIEHREPAARPCCESAAHREPVHGWVFTLLSIPTGPMGGNLDWRFPFVSPAAKRARGARVRQTNWIALNPRAPFVRLASMPARLVLLLVFWVSAFLSGAGPLPAAGPEAQLRGGAFAADITPEKFPVSSTPHADLQVSEVHDRLHARCLVLDDGRKRIGIVVCDNNMVPREVFDAAKAKAAAVAGIPAENLLMAATHTHSAVTLAEISQGKQDRNYIPFFAGRIAEGLRQAVSQLEPVRIGWAAVDEPAHVFNRRWFMKPGYKYVDPLGLGTDRVKMNPPPGHPDLLRPAGPVDPQICILSVQALDGRPVALLANYGLHYVGGVPAKTLSADYFGEFARQIGRAVGAERAQPPFVGILSNGASADVNNIDVRNPAPKREPFEQIRRVAASVADAVARAYRGIRYDHTATVNMREAEIELGVRRPGRNEVERARSRLAAAGPGPYRTLDLEYARETVLLAGYPPAVKVKLQAVRIGPVGIVAIPCETFAETGLGIKRSSPLEPTFVIELANGYNGYLPTPAQHALGGYETWPARSSYLEVRASEKVHSTLLQLLQEAAR